MCDVWGVNGCMGESQLLKCEGHQNRIQRWLIFPKIGKSISGRSSLHQTMLRRESKWFVCPYYASEWGLDPGNEDVGLKSPALLRGSGKQKWNCVTSEGIWRMRCGEVLWQFEGWGPPWAQMFECLVPGCGTVLGRLRICDLDGGSMPLGEWALKF